MSGNNSRYSTARNKAHIFPSALQVHALWVSQNILDRMVPLPDTVAGGKIVRDEAGHPTGIMLDNAMDLVSEYTIRLTHAFPVEFRH